MMRRTLILVVSIVALITYGSCGGSSSDTAPTTVSGVTLRGVVASGAGSIAVPMPMNLSSKAMPSGCPDDEGGGVAINVSPSDNSVKLATKYVRLVKEGGVDYLEIDGCTHSTAAEAEADEVTVGDSASTICQLGSSLTSDAVGTYDEIEMAIYYMEMTVPLIVPQIAEAEADYRFRMYFNDDDANGILARDILIYNENEGKWGWVDWADTSALTYLDEGRPGSLLDAFSNDEFWCDDCDTNPEDCTSGRECSAENTTWEYKNPVVISSSDESGGTDFNLTDSFTINSVSDDTVVTMSFNIADTLTAWASQDQIDTGSTNDIDITDSCGFHPFFPDVTITSE